MISIQIVDIAEVRSLPLAETSAAQDRMSKSPWNATSQSSLENESTDYKDLL